MVLDQQDVQEKTFKELLQTLSFGLSEKFIDLDEVIYSYETGTSEAMTREESLRLLAETCAYKATLHPDYNVLAGRISMSQIHFCTSNDFEVVLDTLHNYKCPYEGVEAPLIARDYYDFAKAHVDEINNAIDYVKDYSYDYFALKTLERSYLLRVDGELVERPQHILMRVALGIHIGDIESALLTYAQMSEKLYTHASPTLFNAGTHKAQMSSCFLLTMKEDSIEGIYETLKQCSLISQSAGGIGLSIHDIRAKGSFIRGTNGYSNGIVPMLKVFNDTARYVDQGGGKRKGAFAIYLEPWHADVEDFLELKKNHGKEEMRARDLFYALWVNDLFMERVESDGQWSLFCPKEAPGLSEVHSQDFVELYTKYEKEGRARKVIKARELWGQILKSQVETGSPYMLYKDAANSKSNQKNLGTIKSSNLCTEIIQYTSKDEVAVCNLASIALPRFIKNEKYDFKALYDVTYQVTKNLNKIIDLNFYPVPEAKNSNLRHRPIGLGVQGLADTFMLMKMPFDSDEAKLLNQQIFETIYYAAVSASSDLAAKDGSYSSFEGSPASKGMLQPDLWNKTPTKLWDWTKLKSKVKRDGLRNSLLLAPMPTASTSQILGNVECIEPITSNLYTRRVLSGEYILINKHLVRDLSEIGLWSKDMKDKLIMHNGSVQDIQEVPAEIKSRYKTVWELKQKRLLEMAADRGAFIDQSQSLNVFFDKPSIGKLSALHFHAWKLGLKTGMYYLRTKPAAQAIKFTVKKDQEKVYTQEEVMACSLDNQDDCIACGS